MKSLMGQYDYALDAKGRLNFPAKFREVMGDEFVVTRWLDHCLVAFPQAEWERVTELLQAKSMVQAREVRRFLYSAADAVTPDKQGRILLAPILRQHAGLEKDVTILGVGAYAEIWDTATWQARQQALDAEDIAGAMAELDF